MANNWGLAYQSGTVFALYFLKKNTCMWFDSSPMSKSHLPTQCGSPRIGDLSPCTSTWCAYLVDEAFWLGYNIRIKQRSFRAVLYMCLRSRGSLIFSAGAHSGLGLLSKNSISIRHCLFSNQVRSFRSSPEFIVANFFCMPNKGTHPKSAWSRSISSLKKTLWIYQTVYIVRASAGAPSFIRLSCRAESVGAEQWLHCA